MRTLPAEGVPGQETLLNWFDIHLRLNRVVATIFLGFVPLDYFFSIDALAWRWEIVTWVGVRTNEYDCIGRLALTSNSNVIVTELCVPKECPCASPNLGARQRCWSVRFRREIRPSWTYHLCM